MPLPSLIEVAKGLTVSRLPLGAGEKKIKNLELSTRNQLQSIITVTNNQIIRYVRNRSVQFKKVLTPEDVDTADVDAILSASAAASRGVMFEEIPVVYYKGKQTAALSLNTRPMFDLPADVTAIANLKRRTGYYAGELISSRYGNKVKNILVDGYTSATPIGEMIRDLRNAASLTKNDATRLVRTEFVRASNLGVLQSYTDNGVKYIEWVTTGDNRVCPICEMLALSSPHRLKDAEQFPTSHPNCRCTQLAYFGKEKTSGKMRQIIREPVSGRTKKAREILKGLKE